MDEWKLPWAGGCRCGRVRLEVTKSPLLTGACHCTGCQRMTAGPFSMSVAVPTDGFAVTHGETVLGGIQDVTQHHHCAFCKSWLYTTAPEMGNFVNLRASTLDDHTWFAPFVETWTREKLPWVQTPASHSFATLPELTAWPDLIADYQKHGPRPH
ncbi:aldehyde-activating protein [bacterium SCN 62-11]|nr:GFA family protein [Candidatus Eremiobacteraeota bacterium]ODT79088.1 MAG: aldehyde-activating protein [bacterium SCN 62-11]